VLEIDLADMSGFEVLVPLVLVVLTHLTNPFLLVEACRS